MKTFETLNQREILALAISLEEEDERVYADYAEGLRQDFPASAAVFDGMRDEESGHRRRLIELYPAEVRRTHPAHPPRQDVQAASCIENRSGWCGRWDSTRCAIRPRAMEVESRRFYEKAAARAKDAGVRQLLDDLAQEERTHEDRAEELEKTELRPDVKGKRGRSQPAPVRAADRAARIGRPDGRFGLDARAGFRRGICDAQYP